MSTEAENIARSNKEMAPTAKYLNIAVQLILIIIAACIVARTVNQVGIVLFTWHPVLVSIGYLLLMTHAILTMADNNFITQNLNYQNRVTVHWILQTSALILITVAQTCIFLNKNRLGKEHYQTTHSLFGLTTYLLTILSSLGGILTKFSFQLKKIVKPTVSKIIHSFAGLLTYFLAMITISLGINQSWTNANDTWTKPIIYVLLAFTTLYVTIKSFILFSSRVANLLQR
ncbi:CLUMA_CG018902, isoform A [Clunio marinus]|uniref:ascorbate ferrireductase (transmembrane) n=1 Tax=Clunio marinus TaxID=568069 RepID=A0A1J1J236_9DIPT|nr:CLUMA_CG018902, isoform A [Clunio marinus]